MAERARVPRSLISDIEHGRFGTTSPERVRAVARTLGIRVDVVALWRGCDLGRLLNARHSALHESVARHFQRLVGWVAVPEVSFSLYGERGIIDIIAYHAASGSLLVIELKTEIVDVNELVGTLDRKVRLAPRIAADRGWHARHASRWVIVARVPPGRARDASLAGGAVRCRLGAVDVAIRRPPTTLALLVASGSEHHDRSVLRDERGRAYLRAISRPFAGMAQASQGPTVDPGDAWLPRLPPAGHTVGGGDA